MARSEPSCRCVTLRPLIGKTSGWRPEETGFEVRSIEHNALTPGRTDIFCRCPTCGTRWRAKEAYDAKEMEALYVWVLEDWDEDTLLLNQYEAEHEQADAKERRQRDDMARERAREPWLPPQTPADHRLLAAAEVGDLDGVRHALRDGADPDVSEASGDTALTVAAQRGDATIVEALLMAGADFTARDSGGQTAFHHAQAQRHTAICELLDPDRQLSVTGNVWRVRACSELDRERLLTFSFELAGLFGPGFPVSNARPVHPDMTDPFSPPKSSDEWSRRRRVKYGAEKTGIEVVFAESYAEGFANGWRSRIESLTAYGLPPGCELAVGGDGRWVTLVVEGPRNVRRAAVLRLQALARSIH